MAITGTLNVGASVASSATTTGFGAADFDHSALCALTPSVAGLNTTGVRGTDFLAPVPEPAAWASLLLGLAALGGLAQVRRSGLPAC